MKNKLLKNLLLKVLLLGIFFVACTVGYNYSNQSSVKKLELTQIPYTYENKFRLGIAVFALLNPNFPINRLIEILKADNNPSFSFVYGAFGKHPDNFYKLMNEVPNAHVVIYLDCSPCRKPRRNGSFEPFHKELSINQFNSKILKDHKLQQDYIHYVTHIKTTFVDPYPYTSFDIYVELESKMTTKAAQKTYNMVQKIFANSANVKIKLNPLPLSRLHRSIPVETHNYGKIKDIRKGDSFCEDGILDANFSSSLANLQKAKKRGVNFYLWRAAYQGFNSSNKNLHPSKRKYHLPDKAKIIKFLRRY